MEGYTSGVWQSSFDAGEKILSNRGHSRSLNILATDLNSRAIKVPHTYCYFCVEGYSKHEDPARASRGMAILIHKRLDLHIVYAIHELA